MQVYQPQEAWEKTSAPDSLGPIFRSVAMNHPTLSIIEISRAGKATTLVSISSCLLYLFIIAIK